jgi:hypothetical protein
MLNDRIQSCLAILISLGISAFIVLVTQKPIYLTSRGSIAQTDRLIYVTGTTILATLLTSFILSQVQHLLRCRLDRGLLSKPDAEIEKKINRKWRTIIRVGDMGDAVSNIKITLCFILLGLITPALVTILTPTVTERAVQYPQKLYNGRSRITVNNGGDCVYIIPTQEALRKTIDTEYTWDLGNGSAYYYGVNIGGCPTRLAQLLIGLINIYDSGNFAYSDGGVAVHRSAIGAPHTIYSPDYALAPEFNQMLSTFQSDARRTAQCVPVMKQNPITCRPGGKVSASTSWLNVTADNGLCSINHQFSNRNLTRQQTMVKRMCPHGDVGQGTIVMAAVGGYAHWLAYSIDDIDHAPAIPPVTAPATNARYAITCTVDARNIYEYREVILNLAATESTGTRNTRFLYSNKTLCAGPAFDLSWYANAAAANWQTLFQNDGLDGWFDLIWEATGHHSRRQPPWAFENSENVLEDVLGLVSALVGSRFNSTSTYTVDTNLTYSATRIGTSDNLALLYLLPTTFALVCLIYLLFSELRQPAAEVDSTDLRRLRSFFTMGGHSKANHQEEFPPFVSGRFYSR